MIMESSNGNCAAGGHQRDPSFPSCESEPTPKRSKVYKNFLRDDSIQVPRTTQWRWNKTGKKESDNKGEADTPTLIDPPENCVVPNDRSEIDLISSCSDAGEVIDEAMVMLPDHIVENCTMHDDTSEINSRYAPGVTDDAPGEVLSHILEYAEGPAHDCPNFAEVDPFEAENARPPDWPEESDDALSDITFYESDNEEIENLVDQDVGNRLNDNLQNDENVNPNVNNGNNEAVEEPTLHTGTTLTLSQFQILFMSQIFKHKTSGQALEDYCKLLELLLPGKVPKSKFLFEKALPAFSGKSKSNIFCAECVGFIGCEGLIENIGNCEICGTPYNVKDSVKNGHFFLTIPVEEQIKKTMESVDDTKLLKKSDAEEDVYTDIVSGSKIQEMYNSGELTDDDLTVLWNFDGVPVFKSSNFSITPIQFTINELPYSTRKKNVLMYGLWFGKQKPKASTFLKPLLDEAVHLAETGMTWRGQSSGREVRSRVFFLAASCDSVARPVIRNTVQFNGAYGCDWCLQEGERVERGNGYARCYPFQEPQPEARTADSQEDLGIEANETGEIIQGVKGVTILSLLPSFDIVEGFVVDYMHCVLLGVTRQFTALWFDSLNHDEPWYIGTFSANIDEALLAIKPPSEITRAPRSLSLRKYWKASEWRSFLLFYSPLVLKRELPDRFYNHWMLLVTCMHGLLKERITEEFLVTAENVLKKFVMLVSKLYGIQHVTFNVHQLTHVVESVRRWGPLWATSAFPFEGNNQILLGLFHGKTSAPKQIADKFNLKIGIKSAAPDILSGACEGAKQLYRRLSHSGRYLPVNEKKVEGVYLYGKPVKKMMSVSSRTALERLIFQPIPADREFDHFYRFSNGKFLCHASTYDRSKKRRNDMVLLDDNTLCLVKELVMLSPGCDCGVGDGACESLPFIVLQRLTVNANAFFTAPRYHIQYDELLEVQGTAESLAVRMDRVIQKCVAVQNNNRLFSVPVPNRFETD